MEKGVERIIIPYYNVENILSKEIVFGKKINDNKYAIENIPLYVDNLALGDVLLVERLDDGKLYFEDLIEKSENSTVRIIFFKYDEVFVQKILKEIEGFGVSWVGFEGGSYFSMNIKKELKYKPIRDFLAKYSS
ncbi:DUF4265 domain-containing protein, partial [Acinetobacter bereziniae]|uniref:DUF4265 domain-containing protein n=1 Tax=Acinetobacter bereziniae TaxID=106648 RepID=UPI0012500512